MAELLGGGREFHAAESVAQAMHVEDDLGKARRTSSIGAAFSVPSGWRPNMTEPISTERTPPSR